MIYLGACLIADVREPSFLVSKTSGSRKLFKIWQNSSAANGDIRPESIIGDMQKGTDTKITFDAGKNHYREG